MCQSIFEKFWRILLPVEKLSWPKNSNSINFLRLACWALFTSQKSFKNAYKFFYWLEKIATWPALRTICEELSKQFLWENLHWKNFYVEKYGISRKNSRKSAVGGMGKMSLWVSSRPSAEPSIPLAYFYLKNWESYEGSRKIKFFKKVQLQTFLNLFVLVGKISNQNQSVEHVSEHLRKIFGNFITGTKTFMAKKQTFSKFSIKFFSQNWL
jgi:hypothetical protein